MSDEVFRSAHLLARARCGFSDRFCVVSFDSYTDHRTLDRQGFGEHFLASSGIDAIHVLQKNNRWYLHPETSALCEAIRSRVGTYERVITYGSSMGGYAAIRYGAAVGAREALALSPQFTIDRSVARFERRWPEADQMDFEQERRSGEAFVPRSVVAYDPCNLDARHVRLFRSMTEVIGLELPFSGHPCSGFLQQVSMLKTLVRDVLLEKLDVSGFAAEAHRRRERSHDYFMALARHSRNRRRREQLGARGVALSGRQPDYVAIHAWWVAQAGDHRTARATLEAMAQSPDPPPAVLFYLSQVVELQGDRRGAIAVMDRLLASHPEVPRFVQRRDQLIRAVPARLALQSLFDRARFAVARRWGAPFRPGVAARALDLAGSDDQTPS